MLLLTSGPSLVQSTSMGEPFCELPDLEHDLRTLIAQVPAGKVTTYGALADALGSRLAAPWVGHLLLHHEHHAGCVCHRVVCADGQVGRYIDGGQPAKARRLVDEGVEVHNGCVDLRRRGFDQFRTDRPLERLKRLQESIVAKVRLRRRSRIPKLLGGVDVSYTNTGEGVAAYALVERDSAALVWSASIRRRVVFPYISTYLSFRELPILLELLDEVLAAGRLAEVLLVDGSGILHQRHAGIATHLGVVASLPTIGVTKKLLCGKVKIDGMELDDSRPVAYQGHLIGLALRTTPGGHRPIFISPGHGLDVEYAERVVRGVLKGHRLPEPLYWADRLSRAGASSRE